MIYHLNILVFGELLQLHLAVMGVGRAQLIAGKEAKNDTLRHKT